MKYDGLKDKSIRWVLRLVCLSWLVLLFWSAIADITDQTRQDIGLMMGFGIPATIIAVIIHTFWKREY